MARELTDVFRGWEGYQTSLVRAIAPRTREELLFRLPGYPFTPGEVAAHIAYGRVDWFSRMGADGAAALAREIAPLFPYGRPEPRLTADPAWIVGWLERGWEMVAANLARWTVDDLDATYRQAYRGEVYAVSRQWTLFRILAHDIQHGGQLTVLLGAQGIALPDLWDQGGHLTEVPLAEEAR